MNQKNEPPKLNSDFNNHHKKGKRKPLHLWTNILACIGSTTNMINNGDTYKPINLITKPSQNQLWNDDDISKINPHILEFKIETQHKSLQTEANKKIRK